MSMHKTQVGLTKTGRSLSESEIEELGHDAEAFEERPRHVQVTISPSPKNASQSDQKKEQHKHTKKHKDGNKVNTQAAKTEAGKYLEGLA